MCFENDDRNKSASASNAMNKNGGAEEDRSGEHEENDDVEEAKEFWRALAINKSCCRRQRREGGRRRQIREMEPVSILFILRSMKSIPLSRRCKINTFVIFTFLHCPIKLPIELSIKLPTELLIPILRRFNHFTLPNLKIETQNPVDWVFNIDWNFQLDSYHQNTTAVNIVLALLHVHVVGRRCT